MFWERFEQLCKSNGTRPNPVASELGISSATITKWKKGTLPSVKRAEQVADYFGVSVDYLLGKTDKKEKPPIDADEELAEYLEELRTRPELRMMFSLTKNATKADVEKAVRVIEAMLGKDGED